MTRSDEQPPSLQRPPYFVSKKAHPFAFKPYDFSAAKRDRHVCHNVSHRLSAAIRRLRSEKRADAEFAAPVADASHIVGAPATQPTPSLGPVGNEAGAANHPPEQTCQR